VNPGHHSPSPNPSPFHRAWRAFRLALAFLTLIPVRIGDHEATESDLAASRYAYPWVGAAIGLSLAAASLGLAHLGVGAGLSAFLLLALWAICSGGLHLDGLADTFDGLFLWGDAQRRLTVMRDPHVGSYGVSVIGLVLLGKFAALGELADLGTSRTWGVLGAAFTSRALILVSAGLAGYARRDGTGRFIIGATTPRDAVMAGLLTLAIGSGTAGAPGLAAAITTLLLALGITDLARRRLGGVTGDTLGALVELSETTYLVVIGILQIH